MSPSRLHSRSVSGSPSMRNSPQLFYTDPLALAAQVTPGSMCDESVVRGIITETIRTCGKSRDLLADEMTLLLGSPITVRMLNSYTSTAAERHRWPAQYTRAFCHATGDWTLLRCITERAGFRLITRAEEKLFELGRQYLAQKQATAAIARLEKDLAGVEL